MILSRANIVFTGFGNTLGNDCTTGGLVLCKPATGDEIVNTLARLLGPKGP